MTSSYYIKIYHLSGTEGADIIESIGDTDTLSKSEVMITFAERWIREIRTQCEDEAQCRAVMYRTMLESVSEIPIPPECSPLLPYAYAHVMTDAVHQAVCKLDLDAKN